MARKNYKPEEIVQHLRTAEIEQSKGATFEQASKKIGVSTQTLSRWRKEFGGLQVNQAKRLKDLEKENSRLKRLVADLSLDNALLKDISTGNF